MSPSIAGESLDAHNKGSVTIGFNPANYQSEQNNINTLSSVDDGSIINQEKAAMSAEFKNARDALKATGKLPISIDNKCLMSMQDGRDTSFVLRLFKTACLSYAPSDINYRDHKMSRP